MHLFAHHFFHGDDDQAVIEQQDVAGFDFARQGFVVQADAVDITGLGAQGVQNEGLPHLQHDLTFCKFTDTDLGALQVGHDGHFASGPLGNGAHHGGAVDMVLRGTVAEVETHNVHAGFDHFFQ